jgi:diadenosine tetraphosphate (Ap4A) HIT family hydrolase
MSKCELCQQQGDVIVSTQQWRVVLIDDKHYPGYCRVIWNAHIKEMSDLTLAERTVLMNVVWQVESAIRTVMKPHKINLASLGNVTPHLHWHVIPRFTDDMHFPNPIWGQVERSINGNLEQRRALIASLKEKITAALQ